MQKVASIHQPLTRFLGSRWFFRVILILFAAETLWLALTSAYPMAFDEGYHFGLIQFFSHHLNPFISSQPSSSYGLGNVVHNPSWLYHYLLSFPYRFTAYFTHNLQTQVIVLRLINIGIALTSLVVLRALLQRIRIPAIITNVVLFLFAMTPVVTALSSQINYDNLVILSSLAAGYLAVRTLAALRKNTFDALSLLGLLALCLIASEGKYSFVPIFFGLGLIISWQLGRQLICRRLSFSVIGHSIRKLGAVKLAALGLAIGVGVLLFTSTYVVNVAKYGNPVPQCNQVLSVAACSHYYAWDRNYQLAQHVSTAPPHQSAVIYTYHWAVSMWYSLYAEIIPTGGIVTIARSFYIILLGLSLFAALCTLSQLKQIFRNYRPLILLSFVAVIYTLFLWSRNYHDYRHLGEAVAVQGRYFVPVLMYAYALLALGVYYSFQNRHAFGRMAHTLLIAVALGSFAYFGGYVRYISEISPSNTWQPQQVVASSTTRL